jgi:drug/metabolite transporter (DMT)-like permease
MIEKIANIFGVITGCWFVFEQTRILIKKLREGKTPPTAPKKIRTRRDYILGIIYSVCCAVLWSLSYISLSYLTPKVGLLAMNVALLGFGTVFLFLGSWLALLWKDEKISSSRISVNWSSPSPWIVTAANIASFILFIYALNFISASQTITLQKINPIFVAIGTWIWLRRKPSRSTLATVFFVVSGTLLITANDRFGFTGGSQITGSLYAILAGASFALFGVGIEKIEQSESGLAGRLRFLAMIFLISYIVIISIAYFRGRMISFDRIVLILLVLNGLRIAVVYALYYAAVRRLGALFASVLVAIEVPLTMLWDWLFLNTSPELRLIWGAVAILLGAITLAWEKSPESNQQNGAVSTTEG